MTSPRETKFKVLIAAFGSCATNHSMESFPPVEGHDPSPTAGIGTVLGRSAIMMPRVLSNLSARASISYLSLGDEHPPVLLDAQFIDRNCLLTAKRSLKPKISTTDSHKHGYGVETNWQG